MARKAGKKAAKRKLKLRKKPLRDLPTGKKAASVKGGATLAGNLLLPAAPQATFAPPYVPVGSVLKDTRLT